MPSNVADFGNGMFEEGSKQIQIGLLLGEKTETQLRVGKGHRKDTRENGHLQAEDRGSRGSRHTFSWALVSTFLN